MRRMTEGGLLYVALAIGIVLIALQFVVLVRAGLARAMLDSRWRDIQGGLDRFERELRQELAQGRQEAAKAARGDRDEQSLSLSRLAQTLAAQLAQLGKLQAQQLESFAQQLSRLTNSNEQRFESLRSSVSRACGWPLRHGSPRCRATMRSSSKRCVEQSMKSCMRRSSSGLVNPSSWSAIASNRSIEGLARCRRWPLALAT